jgi:hypothetical protein
MNNVCSSIDNLSSNVKNNYALLSSFTNINSSFNTVNSSVNNVCSRVDTLNANLNNYALLSSFTNINTSFNTVNTSMNNVCSSIDNLSSNVKNNYVKKNNPTFTGLVTLSNNTVASTINSNVLLYNTQTTGGDIYIGSANANVNISALSFTVNGTTTIGSGGGNANKDLNLSTLCVGNDVRNFSSQFAANISGSLRIYEETGTGDVYNSNINASSSIGTLVLSHGNLGGSSSIVFPSKTQVGDYGYIRYRDNSTDGITNNKGYLEIGCGPTILSGPNSDYVILQKNGGYVGIGGTSPPSYTLDVTGTCQVTTLRAQGTLLLGTNAPTIAMDTVQRSYPINIFTSQNEGGHLLIGSVKSNISMNSSVFLSNTSTFNINGSAFYSNTSLFSINSSIFLLNGNNITNINSSVNNVCGILDNLSSNVANNYVTKNNPAFIGTVTLANNTVATTTNSNVLLYNTQTTGGDIFIGSSSANINISALNFTVNGSPLGSGGIINKDSNFSTLCVGNDVRNFNSQFAMNISGGLRIYEESGTGDLVNSSTNGTNSIGTLVLSHGNAGGSSSIIFPSKNDSGSDYGYITYRDSVTDSTTDQQGRLEIGTQNDVGVYGTNKDILVLQKNGGYVGIGKQNSSYTLDVSGTISSSGSLFINSDGIAGTPAAKISPNINGDESSIGFYQNKAFGGERWVMGHNTYFIGSNNFGLYSSTFAGNVMSFLNSGNVGIGTNTPTQKLDVNGTINSTALTTPTISYGTAATNINMYASSTGNIIIGANGVNVGIGKTPATTNTLDVNGAINGTDLKIGGTSISATYQSQIGYIYYKHNTTQSVANATATTILFNSVKTSNGTYGLSYSNGIFTNNTTTTNIYNINATIVYSGNVTGLRISWIGIDSSDAIGDRIGEVDSPPNSIASESTIANITSNLLLTVGQTFYIRCYQTSGGALNIGTGGGYGGCSLTITCMQT